MIFDFNLEPLIVIVIIITIIQILINYILHHDINISPHVLIRNIIITYTIYLYYTIRNTNIIFYGCGLIILLEIINGNIDLNKNITEAQTDKNVIILDKLNVKKGTRIIDLGCGYGNLLVEAKKRGAICYGVSICKHHIDFIKEQYDISGIVADFKNLPNELDGNFDCVVANGSLEHLGFIEDVNNNTLNQNYEKFFNGVYKIIDETSDNRQIFITCLHKNDKRCEQWSMWDFFNAYLIQMTYGGFYPSSPSGLTNNMKNFTITSQIDATIHYELTSRSGIDGSDYDFGSRFIRNKRLSSLLLQFLSFLNDPYYIQKELYYIFNSWRWQFENNNCIHYWIIGRK